MRYIFKFPDIGEGITEGKILEWYVDKGSAIKENDSIVKIETDKVVTDIPSPRTGTIVSRFGSIGELIQVGAPLVEIEVQGESDDEQSDLAPAKPSAKTSIPVDHGNFGVVGTLEVAGDSAFLPASEEGDTSTENKLRKRTKTLATPVARALAKDLHLNINDIPGTGPAGRVMKKDIHNYHQVQQNKIKKPMPEKTPTHADRISYSPLSQMRKTIAVHMKTAKQLAPHMTLFEEVELSRLMGIRQRHKEMFAQTGTKLTLVPFFFKATALALRKHPIMNGQLDLENDRIIIPEYINISLAVDTPDGLVVPVVRNVDQLTIMEIAQQTKLLADKARERTLTLEDLKEGTFTITNTGSFGGYSAVPIINYPQSAILGTGQVREKPVVKDSKIVIGKVMQLFLSVDHGLIDGGEATRFLNTLVGYLTDPISLIMY